MTSRRGPIFVAGVDRSGLGLLGELLDAHPAIAISRRTNFWSAYHGRFGDLRVPGNLERCVAAMLRSPRIQALQPDPGRLMEEVRRQEPTYGRLLAVLQEQHLRAIGKRRWGDKSHASEGDAAAMFREFPNAVVVHVIRDPRDRYASQANHRRAARGRVGSGVALWRWSLRQAERNRARHPSQYLVVRYEDLVTDPDTTLRQVCAFVGEDFTDEMLRDPGAGAPRRFTTASIGRFRRDLRPREVAFVDLVAGRRMRAVGYEPEPLRLPWRDRLALVALDLPRNLLWMAAWHARQQWVRRRPRAGALPRAASPAVVGGAHAK